MNRLQKIGIALVRWLVVMASVLLIFYLISIIPLAKIHPLISDKLVVLQQLERGLEKNFSTFSAAWVLVAKQKNTERLFEQQCAKIRTQFLIQNTIAYENDTLRKRLGFASQSQYRMLPAEIISRSVDHWFSFVVVDKGSSDGVVAGVAVINQEGLVGYAYEVSAHSTKVILITDPQVSVSCINERTQEVNVLNGRLRLPLEMKYATIHSDIQKGDRLLTSGYSQKFKRNIPLGIVQDVDQPKHKVYKRVSVQQTVQFSKLDIVFFIY